ncbi:8682_t:CDS:10, partial [Ambispora gerdemannii]
MESGISLNFRYSFLALFTTYGLSGIVMLLFGTLCLLDALGLERRVLLSRSVIIISLTLSSLITITTLLAIHAYKFEYARKSVLIVLIAVVIFVAVCSIMIGGVIWRESVRSRDELANEWRQWTDTNACTSSSSPSQPSAGVVYKIVARAPPKPSNKNVLPVNPVHDNVHAHDYVPIVCVCHGVDAECAATSHLLPPPSSVQTTSFELNRLLNSDDRGLSLPPLNAHPTSFLPHRIPYSYQTQQPPPNTSQYRHPDYHPLPHSVQRQSQQQQQSPSHPSPPAYSSWEYSRTSQNNSYKMDHVSLPPTSQTHSFYQDRRMSNHNVHTTNLHSPPSSEHGRTGKKGITNQEELIRPSPVMSITQLLSEPPIEEKAYAFIKSQNGSSTSIANSLHHHQQQGDDDDNDVYKMSRHQQHYHSTTSNRNVQHSRDYGKNNNENDNGENDNDSESVETVTDVEKNVIKIESSAEEVEESKMGEEVDEEIQEAEDEKDKEEKAKSNGLMGSDHENILLHSTYEDKSKDSQDALLLLKDTATTDLQSNYSLSSSSVPQSPLDPAVQDSQATQDEDDSQDIVADNRQISSKKIAAASNRVSLSSDPSLLLVSQQESNGDKQQITLTVSELKQHQQQQYGSSEYTEETSASESESDLDMMDDSKYDEVLVNYMVDIYRRQQRVIDLYKKRCKEKKEILNKRFLSRIQNREGFFHYPQHHRLSLLANKENRRTSPAAKILRGGLIEKLRMSERKRGRGGRSAEEESEIERHHIVNKKMAKQREAYEEEERRGIWRDICRNAIPRMTKIVSQSYTSRTNNCRKIAQLCQKEARKAALKSCKSTKDVQTKARQAMRQMLIFWKRNEKEEREMRKKAEKEAMERMRIEEERREAQRQARKLNFLITQTELYSHFVGKKIGTAAAEETSETSAAVEAESSSSSIMMMTDTYATFETNLTSIDITAFTEINFDEEDDETLKEKARASAQNALAQVREHTRHFDVERRLSSANKEMSVSQQDLDQMNFQNPSSMPSFSEIKQPGMLMCQLKEYQLKGLNWLANLYEQGINGILADEMGLGKTVQSISLMAHLAETHNIWGPFLVIAPSSTLHNWQQEITRFVPALKPLPYWGNPKDRQTLRKFLNRKNLVYSKDAPFHVVITSYQLIVQDKSYFDRTKWQYMVLDEAQAIKSSSSARWKTLLAFQCRNRLLLTGTPIQNSMQELWALLHFIMPTLFDSHQEFSEWFSKDIESHAENKGSLNEHQLRRLHMILKPFMLRRIKKNVQNELGDKIEVEVSCELNARQRMLYRGLREKISVAELLEKATSLNENESVDSLMNLVMQFRKVCNHPELFERADVVAPLAFCDYSSTFMIAREAEFMYIPYSSKNVIEYSIPKIIYRDGGMLNVPCHGSKAGFDTKYLDHLMNIWRPDYIQESLTDVVNDTFSFLRFIDTSPSEASSIFFGPLINRWVLHLLKRVHRTRRRFYITTDNESYPEAPLNTYASLIIMQTAPITSPMNVEMSPLLLELTNIYEHTTRYELSILDPCYMPKVVAPPIEPVCLDKCFYNDQERILFDQSSRNILLGTNPLISEVDTINDFGRYLAESEGKGLLGQTAVLMRVPAMQKLIMDSGKLAKLDKLLEELKAGGHRVLIYFQMTKMIDLMEEYLAYRQYKYLRLDGGSKIADRRDMAKTNTRAGGLGINLTAADTVIFYDSDWNPTVDQQAMDRAHRLGQTKQVTVYRLITKGTIEERILQRAKQKDEIQKVVISGGEFKQVDFKPREIVSLLLEDDELENKLREQQLKRK